MSRTRRPSSIASSLIAISASWIAPRNSACLKSSALASATQSPAAGLLDACLARLGDHAPAPLLNFYRSHRAAHRAKLYVWRSAEPDGGSPEEWRSRAAGRTSMPRWTRLPGRRASDASAQARAALRPIRRCISAVWPPRTVADTASTTGARVSSPMRVGRIESVTINRSGPSGPSSWTRFRQEDPMGRECRDIASLLPRDRPGRRASASCLHLSGRRR